MARVGEGEGVDLSAGSRTGWMGVKEMATKELTVAWMSPTRSGGDIKFCAHFQFPMPDYLPPIPYSKYFANADPVSPVMTQRTARAPSRSAFTRDSEDCSDGTSTVLKSMPRLPSTISPITQARRIW